MSTIVRPASDLDGNATVPPLVNSVGKLGPFPAFRLTSLQAPHPGRLNSRLRGIEG
jgi:hypothetical protein